MSEQAPPTTASEANWLQLIGDTDIMRDATRASTVFLHRAKRNVRLNAAFGGFTFVMLLLLVVALLGPAGTGLSWARQDVFGTIFAMVFVLWLIAGGYLLYKYVPGRNDRVILKLRDWVCDTVDPLEAQVRALSPEALRAKTDEFKQRLADGETAEALRPEAYAVIREASRRAREHRQFECQLIGGKVLEDNNVAEMRTGEGKTIVCYMGAYMKVVQGLKVHMVTVNDYLVKRDAEFCQPIFELLGVSVGYISSQMETYGPGVEQRRAAYGCDITYGTNSEFGFDYLRDNMKHSTRDQVQGQQDFVIVDEVDSILIDEARTPLIISGPAHDDVDNYRVADHVARKLIEKQKQANRETARTLDDLEKNPPGDAGEHFKQGLSKFRKDPLWLSDKEAEAIGHRQFFVVELDRKSAHMTEHGAKAAQQELSIGTFYDSKNMNWPHYLDNALRAHLCYQRDKEYVVQQDQVVIVDEFTGRLMQGRQWSDGLHQAVEAKERVTIKQESQTLATITLQNLFKLYEQLAGMTGTAMTEAEEFMKIYRVEVIAIPTNRPIRRIDFNDKIYKSKQSKFDAIVEEIRAYCQDGHPSDPFSLEDALKRARTVFKDRIHSGDANPRYPAYIEQINKALGAFKGGSGEEAPLAETYRTLMDGKPAGRPVLVGTVSVETSERLSEALQRRFGIEHEVLNAKNHAREADIVVKAGQQHEEHRGKKKMMVGNVTIATNMAGRGTDIRLGPGVAAAGGLHVVGTERHESRRIDNQLRGRCGRQGDPGSSRFFLSMDDDLLRLFMGEWMLKMLNMLGFEEGMAIENKRISGGIERAQKKVEERNFNIRKSLLEYDEVMDHQRKEFYGLRQQVVEARGLSTLIWEMIDRTVADAIDRYYDPNYAAICASEWASQNLGVVIDPERLETDDAEQLREQVRNNALGEARSNVQRTFGEYIDPDTPAEDWDVRGLTTWAGQHGVTLTQNQVRKTNPDELLEQITAGAERSIQEADLSPLEAFCDALLPKQRLVAWARDKFGVEVPLDDLTTAPRDEAEQVLREKMRDAYRRREIEFPVVAVMDWASRAGGSNANEVREIIARWAKRKFQVDWDYATLAEKSSQQVFDELRQYNEDYLTNGKIGEEVEAALEQHQGEAIETWARERFGAAVDLAGLDPQAEDLREQLQQCGYEMLRFELTQLEQRIMLQVFDSVWKDHMYSMDLLRHGIGLRGYAERDPKTEYKREGTRLFNASTEAIRERVTDLIFKINLGGLPPMPGEGEAAAVGAPEGGGSYGAAQTVKADATNMGMSSAAAADQQAAMRKQGDGAAATIRRDQPKVGRNDPCPCGSGKKYKACHGKKA